MGLFSRRREPAAPAWQPPVPPACACARHLDPELLATVVPFAAAPGMDGETPTTVADLVGPGGLSVRPAEARDQPTGGPATFSPEQIVQIVAVACEPPEKSGRPISHWTHRELADEVKRRQIVKDIGSSTTHEILAALEEVTAS